MLAFADAYGGNNVGQTTVLPSWSWQPTGRRFGRELSQSYGIYDTASSAVAAITSDEGVEMNRARLEGKLGEYAALSEGWDGYEGVPARPQSVIDARRFLDSLYARAPIPKPMLAGNGEISLFWESEGDYAEASFPGDGTFHYFIDSPDLTVNEDDLAIGRGALPGKLAAFLRARFY